ARAVFPYNDALPILDESILRDLFAQTIKASEILGVDENLRKQLTETRAKLAPFQIGKGGQLQEWLDDWDMDAPEIHHRHVSHLRSEEHTSELQSRFD